MRRRDPLRLDPLRGQGPSRQGRRADRRTRRVLAGVAASVLAAAVLLGGCQLADDVTTPPPISPILPTEQTTPTGSSTSSAPSTSATPSPSLVVTARPTTPEETAALAAEAEHVYREQQRLIDEYEGKGGATTLPEPLKAYIGGEYATAIEENLRFTHNEERRIEGTTKVTKVSTFSENLQPESLIGVEFCDDQSGLVHIDKTGARVPLTFQVKNRAEFSRGRDGKLQMTANDSTEVASCAG